jgi:hypothetical protein
MDYPSSKRQDKHDSKKKHSAKSIYSSKHIRLAEAVKEKNKTKK